MSNEMTNENSTGLPSETFGNQPMFPLNQQEDLLNNHHHQTVQQMNYQQFNQQLPHQQSIPMYHNQQPMQQQQVMPVHFNQQPTQHYEVPLHHHQQPLQQPGMPMPHSNQFLGVSALQNQQPAVPTYSNSMQAQMMPPKQEPQDSLSFAVLPPNEQQFVMAIVQRTPLQSSAEVMNYAVAEQDKVAKFADVILSSIQTKDTGQAGEALASLVSTVQNFNATIDEDGKVKSKGFLSSMFSGANKAAKKVEKIADDVQREVALSKLQVNAIKNRYNTALQNIERIVDRLEDEKRKLYKNVLQMEQMYETNMQYFKEITLIIIAGHERLRIFKEHDIPQQNSRALQTNDQMEVQRLNEMQDIATEFDRKLHDLTVSRMVSLQSAPQIRMIQKGSQTLINQIHNSITTAIPIWKSQMVLALGMATNRAALGLQRNVSDMTNELLVRNSEAFKLGSIEIAQESERSVVSVEALKKTNDDLISAFSTCLEIQRKGHEDRTIAITEIKRLEQDMKSNFVKRQIE